MDGLSPLEIKRRVKKKPYLRTQLVLPSQKIQDKLPSPSSMFPSGARYYADRNTGNGIRIDAFKNISKLLVKNASFKHNGTGLPTAMAPHNKFIAIGTSHSLVIVFDHFEEVRIVLGSMENTADGAVTSIDFSMDNDGYLVCGYYSGKVVLWDVIGGKELKIIQDAHDSPIINVRFWPASTSAVSIVSVDMQGRINLFTFLKRLFTWSVDRRCLINESTGQKVALCVLPRKSKSRAPDKGKCGSAEPQLLAFSTHSDTYLVSLYPEPRILKRWSKPGNVTAGELPCLSLGWSLAWQTNKLEKAKSTAGRDLHPSLCRGWDRYLQIVAVQSPVGSVEGDCQFNVSHVFCTDLPIVLVDWVCEKRIVYMNTEHIFVVLDLISGTEVEAVNLESASLAYATLPSGKINDENVGGTKHLLSTTCAHVQSYFNSVRACDSRIYVLGQKDLRCVSIQSWQNQVKILQRNGDWIEALLLALENYKLEKKSIGEVSEYDSDLTNHVNREGKQAMNGANDSLVADLLMEYVDISLGKHAGNLDGSYKIVGEMCIDYCANIARNDLLFGPIYERFIKIGQRSTFLNTLQKYILGGKVKHVPAVVMKDYLDFYQLHGQFLTIENSLLKLNPKKFDFDGIIKFCANHKLYDALIYVFNCGMQDFTSPFQFLKDHVVAQCDLDGQTETPLEDLCLRMESNWGEEVEICGRKLIAYAASVLVEKNVIEEVAGLSFPRDQVLDFLFQERSRFTLKIMLIVDASQFFDIFRGIFFKDPKLESSIAIWVPMLNELLSFENLSVDLRNLRFASILIKFVLFIADIYSICVPKHDLVELTRNCLCHLFAFAQLEMYAKETERCVPQFLQLLLTQVPFPLRAKSLEGMEEKIKCVPKALGLFYENHGEYGKALSAYVLSLDSEVFRMVLQAFTSDRVQISDEDKIDLRRLVLTNLPKFVLIDRKQTSLLIRSIFPGQHAIVLNDIGDPLLQFEYLKQLISKDITANEKFEPEIYNQYVKVSKI